jgi:signal transduction histidine kinase
MTFHDIHRVKPQDVLESPIAIAMPEVERLISRAREAAVTEERNRFAREIHDTLAQGLAAIHLQLELARAYDELPQGASQAIELAHQIADENFVEARRLISALRSSTPCLTSALSAAVERARSLGPARVAATLEVVSSPQGEVAHELLRIAQEAIQNAERHAGARTITVTLRSRPGDGLEIVVSDDGDGFDPMRRAAGFGLAGMRERAAAIHADLSIVSAPGAGARVTVTWTPGRDPRTDHPRAQSVPRPSRAPIAQRACAPYPARSPSPN